MRHLFRELEYGGYQVKALGFAGVLGLLLKLLLTEVVALILLMLLELIIDPASLLYLMTSELLTKALVLWMLLHFYREESNPLVLSELMEDAFGEGAESLVIDLPKQSQKRFSRKRFLVLVVLMIMGFRLMYDNSIAYVLMDKIEVSGELVEAFDELFTWPIYALFSVVILAPLYEELLFRKFILGGLLKQVSAFKAIIISALFFGVIHWNWLQGINAFVLGIIIGWLYYKTESIALCIFAHFANNLYAVTLGIVHEAFLMEPILWANSLLCVMGAFILVFSKERVERLMTGINRVNLKMEKDR